MVTKCSLLPYIFLLVENSTVLPLDQTRGPAELSNLEIPDQTGYKEGEERASARSRNQLFSRLRAGLF